MANITDWIIGHVLIVSALDTIAFKALKVQVKNKKG
jgi:hypothetical protein